jgi:hypothetical protein
MDPVSQRLVELMQRHREKIASLEAEALGEKNPEAAREKWAQIVLEAARHLGPLGKGILALENYAREHLFGDELAKRLAIIEEFKEMWHHMYLRLGGRDD